MLSIDQRRRRQMSSFRAGMLNNTWISGKLIDVTPTGGRIQQTRNLNHAIPFKLAEGKVMPRYFREGKLVKIIGRVSGAIDPETGEPILEIRAFDFDKPNLFDMPTLSGWNVETRAGVPQDTSIPEEIASNDGAEAAEPDHGDEDRPSRGGNRFRMPETANSVEIAGIVTAVYLESKPGAERADGSQARGCVVIGIRQTSEPNDIIPIRAYGQKVNTIKKNLPVGAAIYIRGQIRVRNKNKSAEPDESGVIPTHKWPYVHCSAGAIYPIDMNDAMEREEYIKLVPNWLETMLAEYRAKREQRRAAAEARAQINAQAKAQEAAQAQAAPPAARPPQQPAPAAPTQQAPTADTLQKLGL